LREAALHSRDLAGRAVREFGISRQAVARHLSALVEEGLLEAQGQTRSRSYSLRLLAHNAVDLPTTLDLAEDLVWRREIEPHLDGIPENVRQLCQYGFTEMFNNAVDHAGAKRIVAGVERTAVEIEIHVGDDGIGIFRKIREALGLQDERHAVFELTKGKLTTDPERHTGQGIFFSSRMFDRFEIDSHFLQLAHRQGEERPWLIETTETPALSTLVVMKIDPASARTPKEVFDRYSSPETDYSFSTTQIIVDLSRYEGEALLSRSQAKRVMSRCDEFKYVVLDFARVDSIGPAFADEIFRVYQNAHPDIAIRWVNAVPEVQGRITEARSNAS
jgi:anti-sigma regulatory factor (Ser/Thr protein kinase)/DNA-binding transcriptional ArsR family regulator